MAEYVYGTDGHEGHWLTGERIVRCRDCANAAPYGDGIECCGPLVQTWDYYNDEPFHNPVKPTGFCAWGVPKVVVPTTNDADAEVDDGQ